MQLQYNSFGTLASDHHLSHWNDVLKYWGTNAHRKKLIKNSEPAIELLRTLGIKKIFLAGSFASLKEKPGDIDGVFIVDDDFDDEKLEALGFDLLEELEKYGLDFYPADMPTSKTGEPHIDFFRRGRNLESPGLIEVDLTTTPKK